MNKYDDREERLMKMKGMGNMQGMMKQMQKVQKEMQQAQKDLEATIFKAEDHNGFVKVAVNGKKEIQDLEIAAELIDPDDADMLQDIVIATINDALAQVDQESEKKMGRFTQGLNLPF